MPASLLKRANIHIMMIQFLYNCNATKTTHQTNNFANVLELNYFDDNNNNDNNTLDPGQETRSSAKYQKKRTCCVVDFAVPADHRMKIKESNKKKIST